MLRWAAVCTRPKGSIRELALHTKAAKDAVQSAPQTPQVQHTHEDAASLAGRTKSIAADQAILMLLNRRIADQNQLAGTYNQWAAASALQSQALVHGMLLETGNWSDSGHPRVDA